MTTVIDADAAKLAGLQIDTLQKVRNGHLTLGQWEWFNNLSFKDREALVSGGKSDYSQSAFVERFAQSIDLGTLTVPADYVHATQLASFREKNEEKFYYYNNNITDQNFPNPTRILKPSDKFRVKVIPVKTTVTLEECLAKLRTEKAVLVGAQGLTLVFDQKREQLPKDKWYSSFDEKNRLWKNTDGRHRVPYLNVFSDGDFRFDLGGFGYGWGDRGCLVCF